MYLPYHHHKKSFSEGRWITIDLHIHSTYSGGIFNPSQILEFSSQRLFDAIGISDHNEILGALEALQIYKNETGYPEVIVSQEVSAGEHFHLLIIGSNYAWPKTDRDELLERIIAHRQNGGAVILAHPWTIPIDTWASGYLETMLEFNLLDGVEMFNFSIVDLTCEELSIFSEIWNKWFAASHLGIYGGSDFHHFRKGQLIGTGKTFLKVMEPGPKGIIDAIHQRRAVASLSSYQEVDLDWLGKGYRFLYGFDPWVAEIMELNKFLNHHIQSYYQNDRLMKSFLLKMLASGHFQALYELLF
ncbi:PHP domain-containing protein [Hydrogenispora ethanolica]|uniref:PHP domain-containing protein n=1 Tax=Hydrogenispora ethanolica TaxID=1082276 RepID=A0A4R1QZ63_HYDET|nr:PHP domain-containing protein [Hydrogenispora ethanolica]TCL58271.1 PHP domain-containing protein [Hydrogenispora ethanolica]